MKTWPKVRLGEVLRRSAETILPSPGTDYREITVRLWGKGAVLRGVASGATLAGGRRFVARPGQLILSRIDARNGAIALVPDELDGALVSNDFPLFDLDRSKLEPGYLGWVGKTARFVELCQQASEGTTNRVRLQENSFLFLEIPVPTLAEQRRIVARIEELAAKIEEARRLRKEVEANLRGVLLIAYNGITKGAPRRPMAEVAPLKRRPVEVEPSGKYHEIGIRSFGKGTFHKPPIEGLSVGTKKLFRIEADDLLFNIVFAWEGAVAVATPRDHGRVGSHRFLTCVPKKGLATSRFLCFHFLTDEGLEQLGNASPGGAGRNRTLGLKALEEICVPVPAFEKQVWFDSLLAKLDSLKIVHSEATAELDALLPSILDKAFKGEL